MRNRENYNEIMSFVNKERKDTEKQGYFVYDVKDFLIEVEENLINGNSKIANQIYENEIDNEVYVKLKVHKYGDIRANYTDDIILKFDTEYEFYEVLNDTTMFSGTIDTESGEVF